MNKVNKYQQALESVRNWQDIQTKGIMKFFGETEEFKLLQELVDLFIVIEEELEREMEANNNLAHQYSSKRSKNDYWYYKGRASCYRNLLDYFDEDFMKEWGLHGKALAIANKAKQLNEQGLDSSES